MPCKSDSNRFVNDIIQLLFPLDLPNNTDEYILRFRELELLLRKLLYNLKVLLKESPQTIVDNFFDALPEIYENLRKDAESIYKFDPAAASIQEVFHAYPGFYAITVYRLSHQLVLQNVPVLPRVFSEYAHGRTGIDINPGAVIGNNFFIDHGTGVVIGETTHIGNNVKIYQGVTLGALTVEKSMAATKRHPTIEDNVIIYAGSTVLGGKTIIGHDSIIGGNVWLTASVPPNSVVYHKSEVKIRSGKNFGEPLNFVI
ncbi:MAG: serine acetyltransferase [Bacteroidetes bacterium]|nr:MAG: serine acetyltransferase [Bacteroidota bacterium]